MSRFRAAVVGCGRIGAFFDAPGAAHVLTHAHAYQAHPAFEVAAFVDPHLDNAVRAAALWGGRAFRTLEEALGAEAIDVVSVCAPTGAHAGLLERLASSGVRCIFAEKPLTDDPASGRRVLERLTAARIPVLVNYTRRFVGEFRRLRERIAGGECGSYLSGCGYYGKGILNNGSHLVDLVRFLLGEIAGWRVLSGREDAGPGDPTVTAALRLERGGLVHLIETDQRCYTLLELDLLFEKCRFRITDAGFTLAESSPVPDPVWTGYRRLAGGTGGTTSFGSALLQGADHLARVLRGEEAPLCSIADAVRAQEICVEIGDAWQAGRR